MRYLALLLPVCFLFSCIDSPIPFDTTRFSLDLKPGDNRLYTREFKLSSTTDSADVYSVGLFTVVKDTVFNGDTGRIINISAWEFDSDSTSFMPGRELLVEKDGSVSEYDFKGYPTPFLVGLMKAGAVDTSAFQDRMIVAQYPLKVGMPWSIRLASDGTGNPSLDKEYLGQQTLVVLGKKYSCAAFVLHGYADIDIKSWVAPIGLVRAEIDYGSNLQSPSAGESNTTERYDLIGMNVADSTVEKFKAIYKAKSWEAFMPVDTTD